MSGAPAAETSLGNTPFMRVPRVFFLFSSTSTNLARAKRNPSPDLRDIRLAVDPTRNQLTRRFMFFRRLTRFFMVPFTKLAKLLFFSLFFFLFVCIHKTFMASLLSPTQTLLSFCNTAMKHPCEPHTWIALLPDL